MRRTALLQILVTLAFAATTATVFGQATPPPGPPAGGPRGPAAGRMQGPAGLPPALMQRLQLTDQQQSDIRTLIAQQQAARHDANIKLRDLRQQLDVQVFGDAPDMAKVKDLQSQIAAAESDTLAARVDLQMKIAQVLTPEQRAQLLQFFSQPGARRMGRRGR